MANTGLMVYDVNMFTLNASQVGVAGDWHGDTAWAVVALRAFTGTSVQHVFHLGDFGLWGGVAGDMYLSAVNAAAERNNLTVFVTLGNHEDYTQVDAMVPHPEFPGFVYNPSYPAVVFAERGARWTVNGRTFMSLGGANSIDKDNRVEWLTWWSAESITLGDAYRAVEGGHADVMVTHECPAGVELFGTHRDSDAGWSPDAVHYANGSREMMRQVVDSVKPNLLMHGHYHRVVDRYTELSDGVDRYTVRTVGFDMNGAKVGNLAVLTVEDLSVDLVIIPEKLMDSYRVMISAESARQMVADS